MGQTALTVARTWAYWQSDDGPHRRLIVAPSFGDMLAKLRAISTP